MLRRLLNKELRLCLHPAAVLMIPLAALVLVPNYPYAVSFFYLTLGVFFIFLGGRENGDVLFTMTLPVARKDVVTARFLLVMLLELCQMLLIFGCILLRSRWLPTPNQAGMDANLSLLGEGFLFYGLYHLVFFPGYYRDVTRVGRNFVKAAVFAGLFTVADIVCCYTVPAVRDVLDTPDPAHTETKLAALALGFLLWLGLSLLALRRSQAHFEKLDIR